MEIIVLAPTQEHDEFYIINCKHLLSVTYITQVEGMLHPLYKFVQQVEFGLNLEHYVPVYALQLCLANTNVSANIKALQSRQSKQEYDETNYVIDAVPISYQPTEAYDGYGPRKAKKRIRCQIEESPETIPVPEKMRRRLGKCEWLNNNWQMQPRRRHTGKVDKFYYHKLTKIRCRSLIEVENFELYGIIPPHQEFRIQQQHAILPLNSSSAFKGYDQTAMIAYHAQKKEVVEQFLKESYDNLLNLDMDPAYLVATDGGNGEEAPEVTEESSEEEDGTDGEEPYHYDSDEETESEENESP